MSGTFLPASPGSLGSGKTLCFYSLRGSSIPMLSQVMVWKLEIYV